MNIAQNVERGARFFPEKPAIIFEGRSLSYRELDDRAGRCANGLRGLGVGTGDRVALMLPNVPEFVVAYLGSQKLGAIAVSVNPALAPPETHFVLEDAGASVLVTTAELAVSARKLELASLAHVLTVGGAAEGCIGWDQLIAQQSAAACAVEMARDDPAVIIYSSGTLGFPKGVVLSHGNVVSNMYAKNHHLGMRPEDRLLLSVPLFHCFGQNAILNSGLNACATIMLQRESGLEPIIETVSAQRVSMLFAVPALYGLLLSRASVHDLHSVRYCFSAAASLPIDLARRWKAKFGMVIYEGYGLTETTPFASYNHDLRHRLGSIGVPIENVEMRIVSVTDGTELAAGVAGEIVIRGPNVMLGYWNRPDETAEAIRDGWFHTGDVGRTDDDGYFYVVDRLKDMINVGGLKVYPAEVENALREHPAVEDAAVYGLPDPVLGERVVASVVTKSNHTASEPEVVALLRGRIASFKVPTEIRFVDALPRNTSGKVLKRVLQDEMSLADAPHTFTIDNPFEAA